MYLNAGGYSEVQYNSARLRLKAQEIARILPEMMQRLDAQAVAVMGKSGLSLAFAVSMLIDFPLMVVRKRGEYSHGNPVEGTEEIDIKRYLVLDDFVSSGDTVRNLCEIVEERACSTVGAHPRCVGVLQYMRQNCTDDPPDYVACTVWMPKWREGVPVYSMPRSW